MNDPLIQKYAQTAVPRYTSYPTAPHFKESFAPSTYAAWLERLDPEHAISLYVHVPFCKELCWYCGCNMRLATRYSPVAQYVETLLKEIELVSRHLPSRLKISHLHFGGGTPTSLNPDDLERVVNTLKSKFELLDDAELAIESDPRSLSEDMIARIGDLGFTRASFGVQEFAPEVQAAINRRQSPELVSHAITALRAAGVQGINVDLIYGLPLQTVSSLTDTIKTCMDMAPDRVALFGYAHVPWMAKKQRLIDETTLPDAAERERQAEAAARALLEGGYEAIGLDHFALPDDELARAAREGRLHRNFQGYTVDRAETLLGLGVTAIGKTPSGYVQNQPGAGPYGRAIEAGLLPVFKGITVDDDDRLRAEIIERLMCDGSVDVRAVSNQHGRYDQWYADALSELSPLVDDGLVTFDAGCVSMTERGKPLVRLAAAAFDAYRKTNQTPRHSVAV